MASNPEKHLYIDSLHAETFGFLLANKNIFNGSYNNLYASGMGALYAYLSCLGLDSNQILTMYTDIMYRSTKNNVYKYLYNFSMKKLGHNPTFNSLYMSKGKKLTIYLHDNNENKVVEWSYYKTSSNKCIDAVIISCFSGSSDIEPCHTLPIDSLPSETICICNIYSRLYQELQRSKSMLYPSNKYICINVDTGPLSYMNFMNVVRNVYIEYFSKDGWL